MKTDVIFENVVKSLHSMNCTDNLQHNLIKNSINKNRFVNGKNITRLESKVKAHMQEEPLSG